MTEVRETTHTERREEGGGVGGERKEADKGKINEIILKIEIQ